MAGRGVLAYGTGETYEGSFADGKMEGRGILTYPDGNKYKGEFKDSKKCGKGVMYDENGVGVVRGEWVDDELVVIPTHEDLRRQTIRLESTKMFDDFEAIDRGEKSLSFLVPSN